jgi:hypothetical protein
MQIQRLRIGKLFIALCCTAGVACGAANPVVETPTDGGQGADSGPAATDARATGASLNDGYKKATWGAGVTVTYGDCTMRYKSNGLPNHKRDAEYALPNAGVLVPSAATAHAVADPSVAQAYDITIPTCPAVQATSTKSSLGNIGYMISGASLFNGYEGDNSTIALANNFSVPGTNGGTAAFVDTCNGHPTPRGQYHYHGLPACVTATVDTANGPSHIIGIALDGFPVYGNRDINGAEVKVTQLDECDGITSPTPEFPAGVYHYVLPNTTDATSAMKCYKGAVAATNGGGMGPPGGGMPPPGGGPPPGGAMGPPPGGAAWPPPGAGMRPPALEEQTLEQSPCGTESPLASRDPSRAKRIMAGIAQSLRNPFGVF